MTGGGGSGVTALACGGPGAAIPEVVAVPIRGVLDRAATSARTGGAAAERTVSPPEAPPDHSACTPQPSARPAASAPAPIQIFCRPRGERRNSESRTALLTSAA